MKESKYNIFLQENSKVLCFNSFNNSYVIISKESFQVLKEKGICDFERLAPQTYKALVSYGFIIDDSIDELALLRMENKREAFSPDVDFLMVYPTQDCNLKCWYCYETHVPRSLMSKSVLDATKRYITRLCHYSKNKVLRLTFFGGEPFLYYKKVVLPLLIHAYKLCEGNDKHLVPFFVTNASMITENIISELAPFHPIFQITLDGSQLRHDKVRIWKSTNRGTYNHIIKTILLLSKTIERGPGNRGNIITVRINYDDNTLNGIDDIIHDLKDVDKTKVFFQLERVWQTMGHADVEQQRKLKNTLLHLTSEGFIVSHGLFGFKRVACPAEIYNYAVINWDGKVYKCNGRTLKEANSEGILLDDGTVKWNETKRSKRTAIATFENASCLKCKMLPQCMGPCSQKIIENKGGNISEICSMQYADMGLEDYIHTNFEMEIIKRKIAEKNG